MITNLSLMHRLPLSVTPSSLGQQQTWSRNSLINEHHAGSGYNPWWPLCFHRINFIVEPLTLSHDPFVIRYFVCPRFDRRYPIPSSSSLLTNIFYSSFNITTLWPSHTLAQALWCNIIEWVQSTYLSLGWTNLVWSIHTPQHIYLGIPKMHLYGYPITV